MPSFSSFTPAQARVGETVDIFGSSLFSITEVTICGVTASFTALSSSHIQATVPNGAAGAGGTITIYWSTGTASRAGFTPLYPGPWKTSPEGSYSAIPVGGPDEAWESTIAEARGSGAPDPATSWSHPGSLSVWDIRESVNTSSSTSTWFARVVLGLIDLSALDMTSPGPTPAEEANPHYVSWESETPNGTPNWPVALDYELDVSDLAYFDDVEGKTSSPPPDNMQGSTQLRRVPDTDYTVDGFGIASLNVDAWPTPSTQTAWPVRHQTDLLTGKTLAVSSGGGGYTDNEVTATPATTATFSESVAEADLDASWRMALLLTLSRWAAGTALAEPTVVIPGPEGQTAHGGFKGNTLNGPLRVIATVAATFTYRPPRYRILYDRPLSFPTVRQRQIPNTVRQRQTATNVRQRQMPR